MGRTWGHQIRETQTSWATGISYPAYGDCQGRRCTHAAEVFLSYCYVTGRRGRVSRNTRRMCRACAQKTIDQAEPETT